MSETVLQNGVGLILGDTQSADTRKVKAPAADSAGSASPATWNWFEVKH